MPSNKPDHRRPPLEVEEIIIIVRLNLYNRGLPCGDRAIHRELESLLIKPLPSLSAINRILSRYGLTHRRTGHYEQGIK